MICSSYVSISKAKRKLVPSNIRVQAELVIYITVTWHYVRFFKQPNPNLCVIEGMNKHHIQD